MRDDMGRRESASAVWLLRLLLPSPSLHFCSCGHHGADRGWRTPHDGRFDNASGDTGIADSACPCGTFHDTIRLKKPPRTSRPWQLPVSGIMFSSSAWF
jgi:hypothetical protein